MLCVIQVAPFLMYTFARNLIKFNIDFIQLFAEHAKREFVVCVRGGRIDQNRFKLTVVVERTRVGK